MWKGGGLIRSTMGVVYGISTGFTTVFLVFSHAVIDRLWEENEILMLRLMLLFQK